MMKYNEYPIKKLEDTILLSYNGPFKSIITIQMKHVYLSCARISSTTMPCDAKQNCYQQSLNSMIP